MSGDEEMDTHSHHHVWRELEMQTSVGEGEKEGRGKSSVCVCVCVCMKVEKGGVEPSVKKCAGSLSTCDRMYCNCHSLSRSLSQSLVSMSRCLSNPVVSVLDPSHPFASFSLSFLLST
jgi:hypothetical protein